MAVAAAEPNGSIQLSSGLVTVKLPEGKVFDVDLISFYFELASLSKEHAQDDMAYLRAVVELVKLVGVELSIGQASELVSAITMAYLQKKREQGDSLSAMLSSLSSTGSPRSDLRQST